MKRRHAEITWQKELKKATHTNKHDQRPKNTPTITPNQQAPQINKPYTPPPTMANQRLTKTRQLRQKQIKSTKAVHNQTAIEF